MPERTHWTAVAAALLAGIIGGASIGKIPTALPLIRDEFELSLIATGWLATTFNVVAASGAIFFGLLCDRVGALRFCWFGVLAQIAGALIGVLAPDAFTVMASRAVEGVGFVAVIVSAPALIAAASAPRERGLALGLWGTHMPIGASATVALSPLVTGAFGWRGLWLAVAGFAVAVGVFCATQSARYAGARTGVSRSLAEIRSSLAQPVPWLLGTAFALYTMQFTLVMVWLPTYLSETRASGPTGAALLTAAYVFVNVFGNVCGSFFVHRNVPSGRIIRSTFLLTTACFIGIFSGVLPEGLRLALALVYSFVTGNIPPSVFSASVRYARSPAEVGSSQGLVVQLSNLGTFVGAPAAAAVVTWSGAWNAAGWLLLSAGLIGVAVASAILRFERDPSGSGLRRAL